MRKCAKISTQNEEVPNYLFASAITFDTLRFLKIASEFPSLQKSSTTPTTYDDEVKQWGSKEVVKGFEYTIIHSLSVIWSFLATVWVELFQAILPIEVPPLLLISQKVLQAT